MRQESTLFKKAMPPLHYRLKAIRDGAGDKLPRSLSL